MSRGERGVALITVLLIGALASIIAMTMLSRHHLAVAKTRQVIYAGQATQYALGAEAWARVLLRRDLLEDGRNPKVDGIGDLWARSRPPFDVDQGTLEIRISDLQGRLNLNAAGDNAVRQRLASLFASAGLPPDATVALLQDWIDIDQDAQLQGGEDALYLLEEPAYRTADTDLASVSELNLLAGPDAEAIRTLQPFVTTLPPEVRRININTAPPEVLQTLAPELGVGGAQGYAWPQTPYDSVQQLVEAEAAFAGSADLMTVNSLFFEVSVRCEYQGQTVTMRSIIHRDPANGSTRVLARDLGPAWLLPDTASEDDS